MIGIPIGAAVREKATGKLGRRTVAARHLQRRAYIAVLFDGEAAARHVRISNLDYVAKRYQVAKGSERQEVPQR